MVQAVLTEPHCTMLPCRVPYILQDGGGRQTTFTDEESPQVTDFIDLCGHLRMLKNAHD